MLKLLIVLLFFLKIKCESEHDFMKKLLSRDRTFDEQHNSKANKYSNKDRLYLDNLITQRVSRGLTGQSSEFNRNRALQGSKNKEFGLFQTQLNRLESPNSMKPPYQTRREKIQPTQGILNMNPQEQINSRLIYQFTDFWSTKKNPLLKRNTTTKVLEQANYNRGCKIVNAIQDKLANPKPDSKFLTNTDNSVNEVPVNILKNQFDEISEDDESNKYEISNYKSDTRHGCLPNVNKARKTGGPVILFDHEQDDGPVSLIYSLINLNTLRPRTRLNFTQLGMRKKGTTPDPCKCLTKTSTTKRTINDRCAKTEISCSTIICQSKSRNNESKSQTHQPVSTKCSTEKSCLTTKEKDKSKTQTHKPVPTMCSTEKSCLMKEKGSEPKKHYTPLFTVLPWPEINLTRNFCFSSKSTSKTNFDRTYSIPISSSFPPRIFSSPLETHPQITNPLPYKTEKSSQKDTPTENTNRADKIPYSLENTSQQVHTTTPSVQTQSLLGNGISELQQGKHITSSMPNTQGNKTVCTLCVPCLPLVSTEVGGENNTSTQKPKVTTLAMKLDQIKSSFTGTSSTLLTTLINLSQGIVTQPPFTRPNNSTQEATVASSNQITLSITSSAPPSNVININQVNSTNAETLPNTSKTESTTESTPFVATPQQAVKNTEINEPETSTIQFTEVKIPSNGSSNRDVSSSLLQQSVKSTNPGIENPPIFSIGSSSTSLGTPASNVIALTTPDQNQNLPSSGSSKRLEAGVPETTCSLFPLCPNNIFYSVESTTIAKEIGHDELNKLIPRPFSPTTNTENYTPILKETSLESLDDSQIMSFSPPPPAVFSHEPEFIQTLFNDGMSGNTVCGDIFGNTPSNSIDHLEKLEPEPSQLKDLFNFPQVNILDVTSEPVQGTIQQIQTSNEELTAATAPTDPKQSMLLGYLKSFTSADNMGTFSKGPMKGYFTKSSDFNAANKCLIDFSRLFSNLETSKCR